MSSPLGDMGGLLRQAQQMQRELDRVRDELRRASVTGTSGGGAVRIELSGDRRVLKVEIEAQVAASGDKSMLEDLVTAALRDALTRVDALAEESMGRVTGGLQLPGLG